MLRSEQRGDHPEARSSRLLRGGSLKSRNILKHYDRRVWGWGGGDEVKARNKVYLNVIQLKVLAVT